MSRVGNAPIAIPNNVEVKIDGQHVEVKGPKGTKDLDMPAPITASVEDNQILVARPDDHRCLLYTSPSPRDLSTSRMPSSA